MPTACASAENLVCLVSFADLTFESLQTSEKRSCGLTYIIDASGRSRSLPRLETHSERSPSRRVANI